MIVNGKKIENKFYRYELEMDAYDIMDILISVMEPDKYTIGVFNELCGGCSEKVGEWTHDVSEIPNLVDKYDADDFDIEMFFGDDRAFVSGRIDGDKTIIVCEEKLKDFFDDFEESLQESSKSEGK